MHEKTRKIHEEGNLIPPKESYAFMEAAFEGYKEVSPRFLEGGYESASALELGKRNLSSQRQVPSEALYQGEQPDPHYICDFRAFEKMAIRLKAIRAITGPEIAQVLNILKTTGLSLALILKVSSNDKLAWKRVAPSRA